jgi:hypothetical protein
MVIRRTIPLGGLSGALLCFAMGCASAPGEGELDQDHVEPAAATVREMRTMAAPGPRFRRATPEEVAAHAARIDTARENARQREIAMSSLLDRIVQSHDIDARAALIDEYGRLVDGQGAIAKRAAFDRLAAAMQPK